MIEQRDEELSRIYRDAEGPRPPQRVDDNILAASQRVAGLVRRPAAIGFARRWGVPAAVAATVLVASSLTLTVYERQSGLDATAPQVPRAGRPAKASTAAPKAAVAPPAVLQPIAPAPPIPPDALRRDLPQQYPGGASSGGPGPGQPAFPEVPRTPEAPRTAEALRKREEAKPAPAAPAPGANIRAGTIPPQASVPDAQRAFEVQPPVRPVQVPAAAPEASPRPDSKIRIQSAISGSTGIRGTEFPANPNTNERTPEKWLDDIRKLRMEGKMSEADRELAEFKKRYPDYRLPEDLP
jgi:hypothetical protein